MVSVIIISKLLTTLVTVNSLWWFLLSWEYVKCFTGKYLHFWKYLNFLPYNVKCIMSNKSREASVPKMSWMHSPISLEYWLVIHDRHIHLTGISYKAINMDMLHLFNALLLFNNYFGIPTSFFSLDYFIYNPEPKLCPFE